MIPLCLRRKLPCSITLMSDWYNRENVLKNFDELIDKTRINNNNKQYIIDNVFRQSQQNLRRGNK